MANNEKQVIAAFDFDHTITVKDSLFHFILWVFGWPRFLIGLIKFSPNFIKYFFGKISNSQAKEQLMGIFFEGMPLTQMNKYGESYKNSINQILNNEAIKKINWHKSQGHRLIIISASAKSWIEPWAQSMGFEKVLATELEVIDSKLTGKFSTKNCHGIEKANRLLATFPDRKSYQLYAYGDSNGDSELLAEADFPFYRKFS